MATNNTPFTFKEVRQISRNLFSLFKFGVEFERDWILNRTNLTKTKFTVIKMLYVFPFLAFVGYLLYVNAPTLSESTPGYDADAEVTMMIFKVIPIIFIVKYTTSILVTYILCKINYIRRPSKAPDALWSRL